MSVVFAEEDELGVQVSVWLHHQDCLVCKCSAHQSSVLALDELSEE